MAKPSKEVCKCGHEPRFHADPSSHNLGTNHCTKGDCNCQRYESKNAPDYEAHNKEMHAIADAINNGAQPAIRTDTMGEKAEMLNEEQDPRTFEEARADGEFDG